jgi:hypothetical protein
MGVLLTTEWGVGGKVEWKGNRETITPEAPLEPGTHYRLWTFFFMTVRNDHLENCPRIGGEIFFTTAGAPPPDGNPVREIDLSAFYEGDARGMGRLRGRMTSRHELLHLVTLEDPMLGKATWVYYDGTPVLREGEMILFQQLQEGDILDVTFSGGRASLIQVLSENPSK